MSVITGDEDEVAREADSAINAARQGCIERGEGLNPMHVYLDDGGKCACGLGPDLNERRMK